MNDTFNRLKHFKFCKLGNFPFIEQVFDALTYYELLCKIVEYLNNVITSQNEVVDGMNELIDLYNELKAYVDNYFNNLDVQQEVNNKLDAMVQDGTLAEIINEEIFGELNQKIDNFKIGNVLNYGAKGDGVTDDTNSFKTCIAENDIIYVPTGKYIISDTLEVTNKVIKGFEMSELIITTDKNLFDIGFHTKIDGLNIKCTVDNYSKAVFEMSSRTFGNDVNIGNYADIEICNIKSLYFNEMPTTSTGTLFLIYASKYNGGAENNTVLGFWGIHIHDIVSFQYYKYGIRCYVTAYENTDCWITGCHFANIEIMRNNYFWFGKKDDTNLLDATGYRDGDHIMFNNIQVQYDYMMKYAYYFTSGDKEITDSIVWDFPTGDDKPYTFVQQNANTIQYPITIYNEYGSISDRCSIINAGNSELSKLFVFDYKNKNSREVMLNTKGLLMNSVNSNIYYYLCRVHKQQIFNFNILVNRDNDIFNGGNSMYGLNFKGNLSGDGTSYTFNVKLMFGGVSIQDIPSFFYKFVTIDGIEYVEIYCSKWGGTGDITVLTSLGINDTLQDNNRVLPVIPKELAEVPSGLNTITIQELSNRIPISSAITTTGNGASVGVETYDITTHKHKSVDYYGWSSYQKIWVGHRDNMTYKETGMMIFDTNQGKPLWFNGTNWVDANGTIV